jgi:hypothetical protein
MLGSSRSPARNPNIVTCYVWYVKCECVYSQDASVLF